MTSDREKWLSIGVLKPQHPGDKAFAKDGPAYKRLRQDGTQPKKIDGCAELEARACDRQEIEMGHLYSSPEEKAHMQEGMRLAEEIRFSDNST